MSRFVQILGIAWMTLSLAGPSTFAADPKPAVLQIGTKGDENLYNKDKLSVKAGQTVKLTLKNNAKGMQHNLVVTQMGASDEVATAGIQAGADKGWIPAGSPQV